jgi:divalent metal cation (Fe/Co/Zn/Cd) transporter
LFVAVLILKESYNLMRRAFNPLLDSSLENEEYDRLVDTLRQLEVSFHNLKTRSAGHYRFVEFHMEMQGNVELESVHNFCDAIEEKLKKEFRNLEVIIHVEPLRKPTE